MTATIRTRNETYHIEVIIGVKYLCLIQFNLINVYFAELQPSWRHLHDGDQLTMITYKGSDVKNSWETDDTDEDLDGPNLPICAYVNTSL